MTTKITLPAVFRVNAIDLFTQNIVSLSGYPKDREFIFDFKKLDFIDGTGYTVLSNTIEWLLHNKVSVLFENINEIKREGIIYLDSCGFFRKYLNKSLLTDNGTRPATLPCTSVEFATSFSWIERTLSPWLSHALNASYPSLSGIRTCIKELFNNISDHAAVNTGFIHAQHYRNVRKINVTVSDFGIGIPATIRKQFGKMTDSEAILLASKEGVTSQSRPNNMGAGLNFLIDCVTGNGGSVLIHSFSGSLNCYNEGRQQRRRPSTWRGAYPGTLVDITLDTRLFVGDDDERGEVEW